jgi:RHS repeat-associated protein
MESISTVPTAAKKKLEFEYDYRWRRISKKVYEWNAGTSGYDLAESRGFVYDEWNLIAELDGNDDLLCSYAWGHDLSGNRRGAGGVGGLVMLSHHTEGDHFAGYDGNGNVMGLISGATKTFSATYEYGPFGEVLRADGPMAEVNPFRFSTKYQDDETGLNYYGFRYYNAGTGRWLNKDPIGEKGGLNVYCFVGNRPIGAVDPWGLFTSVDRDVLDHAWNSPSPFTSWQVRPPLTIESSRVGITGSEAGITNQLSSDGELLCGCSTTIQVSALVNIVTDHKWSLGRLNVQLEGTLTKRARGQSSVIWSFSGTADPQTDRFNFDPFKGREWSAEVVTLLGAIGQHAFGVESFDILFTGPVSITTLGTTQCGAP